MVGTVYEYTHRDTKSCNFSTTCILVDYNSLVNMTILYIGKRVNSEKTVIRRPRVNFEVKIKLELESISVVSVVLKYPRFQLLNGDKGEKLKKVKKLYLKCRSNGEQLRSFGILPEVFLILACFCDYHDNVLRGRIDVRWRTRVPVDVLHGEIESFLTSHVGWTRLFHGFRRRFRVRDLKDLVDHGHVRFRAGGMIDGDLLVGLQRRHYIPRPWSVCCGKIIGFSATSSLVTRQRSLEEEFCAKFVVLFVIAFKYVFLKNSD